MLLLLAGIAGLFLLPPPWNVIAVVAAAVIEVGEVFFWLRFLRRYRIRSGPEALVGERAEVTSECDPRGRVRLRGELWSARAVPVAARGATVRVIGVEGLTLLVEPEDDASAPG